jgi:hypothetical protein
MKKESTNTNKNKQELEESFKSKFGREYKKGI